MSTGLMLSVPSAIAATACTPPSTWISSAPPRCIAAIVAGCGSPSIGRRAGDDARHARDFRGHDAHVRRGDHRITPARDVAANAFDGDVLVAEDDARQRLDLDVAQRVALDLGEVADLRLREADVRERVLAGPSPRWRRCRRGAAGRRAATTCRTSATARARPRRRAPRRPRVCLRPWRASWRRLLAAGRPARPS